MKSKALILAAAFVAAGVATSMAQVYSVNAVGYVNVDLTPGFNLVSNPLDAGAGNNTLAKLFSNIEGGVPAGTRVFVFNTTTGAFDSALYSSVFNAYTPQAIADKEVKVGEGAFVSLPGTVNKKLTFVGEVMQGTLNNPLPAGFSVKANMVPQSGPPDSFGLPGSAGDRLFKFNKTTGAYSSSLFSSVFNAWSPALPSIAVGEAFFFFKSGTTGATWTRTFNVNNPA
jgi:hypothetical protein